MTNDPLSRDERSIRMGLVKNKGTKPELLVRRLTHAMGYRYRLHARMLPGHPDMVFSSRRKVIFVHGCFWHRHGNCPLTRLPKSRLDFWAPKLERNKERDALNQAKLIDMGWRSLVVWECELRDLDELRHRIRSFLEDT